MSWDYESTDIEELKGKTFTDIDRGDSCIIFVTDDGEQYMMHHEQDCCERVYIESVVGDLHDLINTPILLAEASSSKHAPPPNPSYEYESYTWTFYKFGTIKGYVDIRWFGSSNGYYGERARIVKWKEDEPLDDYLN